MNNDIEIVFSPNISLCDSAHFMQYSLLVALKIKK